MLIIYLIVIAIKLTIIIIVIINNCKLNISDSITNNDLINENIKIITLTIIIVIKLLSLIN